MNLSEENLDKLKTFIKENNFVNNSNSAENCQKSNIELKKKIYYIFYKAQFC